MTMITLMEIVITIFINNNVSVIDCGDDCHDDRRVWCGEKGEVGKWRQEEI